MIKHVYSKEGGQFLRTEEAMPECGEDFCDLCGDCLACYYGQYCPETSDNQHIWSEVER